ncbi:unnamed protein product [Effrenium voratum]|nr:unnamed protein product [Effrenium voratum]
MEELLIKPLDWPHGSLQWWVWCKALRSATWEVRCGDLQPGLEAALLFWWRSPGVVRYSGGAATACDLLVHFKAAWPLCWGRMATWPDVYIQRTDEEQKWLERLLGGPHAGCWYYVVAFAVMAAASLGSFDLFGISAVGNVKGFAQSPAGSSVVGMGGDGFGYHGFFLLCSHLALAWREDPCSNCEPGNYGDPPASICTTMG